MKVLVIGGGFGGLTACTSIRKFDKQVEIVLVEPKEYFEVAWAAARAMFDEDLAKKACFDLKQWALPKSVTHIKATVTRLEGTTASLSNGDVVEFDVCVIAVGATTRWPAIGRGPPLPGHDGTMQRRLEILDREGKKLLSKNSVMIVGGGLIGVEVAGDLASFAKQDGKEIDITLVHSKGQLCPEFKEKASFMVLAKLEGLGVKVILNEKVVKRENELFLENRNEKVMANHIIWTTGLNPINKFVDKKLLDKRGWLQTDDYFRVKGMENKYFAIGDCCDLLPNSAARIMDNIGVIGKNVKAALDAIEANDFQDIEKKMRLALGKTEIFIATCGPTTGVAQIGNCYTTQFFLPWLKNSTFLLFKPKMDFSLKN